MENSPLKVEISLGVSSYGSFKRKEYRWSGAFLFSRFRRRLQEKRNRTARQKKTAIPRDSREIAVRILPLRIHVTES